MKGYVNTNIGEVSINEDVIASYAGSAAIECFGIVGMASLSMISGLATLLKKDNLSKGVEITIENNEPPCLRKTTLARVLKLLLKITRLLPSSI